MDHILSQINVLYIFTPCVCKTFYYYSPIYPSSYKLSLSFSAFVLSVLMEHQYVSTPETSAYFTKLHTQTSLTIYVFEFRVVMLKEPSQGMWVQDYWLMGKDI
jgi:hypothetical protein